MTTYKLKYHYNFTITKSCYSLERALEEANFTIEHGDKKITQIDVIEKRGKIKNTLSIKNRGGKEIRDLKL
jgi:hypothetical protein